MGQARIKRQRKAAAEVGEVTRDARAHRRETFARMRHGTVAIVVAPQPLAQPTPSGPHAIAAINILGSGVLIDQTGTVVTAKHVVQPLLDAARRAAHSSPPGPVVPPQVLFIGRATAANRPTLQPGQEIAWDMAITVMPAQHVIEHDLADVALIYCGAGELIEQSIGSALKLSDEDACEGDEVVACGFPLGRSLHSDLYDGLVFSPSFSRGVVSAVLPHPAAQPKSRPFFQFDATILGGNSGGPVCDAVTGEVVGLTISTTSQRISYQDPAGQAASADVPIGFPRALPVYTIREFVRLNPRPRAPVQP